MIATAVMNFIGGGVLRNVFGYLNAAQENRHQHMMLTSRVSIDRINSMYGGEDKLTDKMSRRVRNILALMVISTYCFLVGWIVIVDPNVSFSIPVDSTPGIFCGWFGDTTNKTTMVISGGSILWAYIELASLVAGYYFMKPGKSR